MTSDLPRPSYDPELLPFLKLLPIPHTITEDVFKLIRSSSDLLPPTDVPALINGRPIKQEELSIPGLKATDSEIKLSALISTKSGGQNLKPCLLFIHGGGMIMGDRYLGIDFVLDVVAENDAIGFSVEYRLAPEHPFPAGVEDCYAALKWIGAHAAEWNIDSERIVVVGKSGGGGLAAGAVLMAKNEGLGGTKLAGQLLAYPMIDDRNITLSSKQFVEEGVWSRGSNQFAWDCILGDKVGTDNVSIYAAPARATVEEVSGSPDTLITVGECEVFRDENVEYASKLWAAGVNTELHVFPGAYHGPDMFAPTSAAGGALKAAEYAWLKRKLALKTKEPAPSSTSMAEAVGVL